MVRTSIVACAISRWFILSDSISALHVDLLLMRTGKTLFRKDLSILQDKPD
ncbi:hypothetical protein [Paenibacillus graminis]|uniref:hypothetical protein n=1 Tax=Paenibacillus graminis TaxID=189425 RepID=UPI002DBA1A3F|nr:hypothetical protein [Paenibacillus graminis]MEC0170727.1 hypothetical protein [Paenibacillus graminis]